MTFVNDWRNPDSAYANRPLIPGGDDYPERWLARAEAFRASLGARATLDIPYGSGPRNRFDLFMPEATPKGLMVFIHGGYWIQFAKESWSHLAAGALARGFACAMPSYTLAPQASVATMAREAAAAIAAAADRIKGPLVVSGHSAGGHLAARMACHDGPKGIARVVPISALSDLEPMMATAMQEKLQLTAEQCAQESPARLKKRGEVQVHVWVGGSERPAFLWHARLLAEVWSCPWTVDAGRHHFDVIDGLTDPNAALMETCLGGL